MLEAGFRHTEGLRCRMEPGRGAFGAEREQRRQMLRPALVERGAGFGQKRLRQQIFGIGTNARHLPGLSGRQRHDLADAKIAKQTGKLIFHDVGETADDHELLFVAERQIGHQRGKAGVFALRERGLDTAARIVEHAHIGRKAAVQPLRRA